LTNSVSTLRPRKLRILDLAVELAVGKGAGAALAELHVRLRVELALAPQAPGVLGAFAHRLAALQDQRPKAHLRQQQAGEEAAGPGADHHGTRLRRRRWRAGDETVGSVRRRADVGVVGEPCQHGRFVAQGDVERIGEEYGGAFAGVVTTAKHAVAEQFVGGDPQPLHDGRAQVGIAMVEGEAEFGQAHGSGRAGIALGRILVEARPGVGAGATAIQRRGAGDSRKALTCATYSMSTVRMWR
jgi:hypothetical protein